MSGDDAFEIVRRAPSPALAGVVSAYSGYRERCAAPVRQREAASLVVPLIISFDEPFRIRLGEDAGAGDAQPSFVAGLFAGPVSIASNGRSACLQIDFTPIGAWRVLGGAAGAIADRMVAVDSLFGAHGSELVEAIGSARDWPARFAIAESFVLKRVDEPPRDEVAHAYRRLAATGGRLPIGRLAHEVGWSRKHLAASFSAVFGHTPKTIARIFRFECACSLARRGGTGWADVAAGAGYADQPHLIRDFSSLAGETPVAWAARTAAMDVRLLRDG